MENNVSLKNDSNDNNISSILVISIIILIILFIMLFNYTFNRRNFSKTKGINYKTKHELKFTNLKSCNENYNEMENYKLCDYYILSSYNTHLIGNQKYDYVSIDMIRKVLSSGARYIDLEICADSLDKNSEPVIASGRLKGEWINSLNTLDPNEVFSTIDNIAFEFENGNRKINYPLFINLKLRTENTRVLNKLSSIIKSRMNKNRILDPKKYYKYPISIEKICKLKNKIIFFAEGNWSSTKLTELVIPTFQCLSKFHYNEIDSISKTGSDNKILNTIQDDRKKSKLFFKDYPSINSLIKKKNEVYDDVIKGNKYINPLEEYNKLCLSVIVPHTLDDVFTLNYDDSSAIQNGCNFITMNFQSDDEFMNQNIDLFKESSFVLKDVNLRYPLKENKVIDINKLFPLDNNDTLHIDTNTIIKYNNQPVRIKTYSPNSMSKYLTCIGRNIKLHSKHKPNKMEFDDTGTINFTDIKQGFMFVPSYIYSKNIKNGVMIRKIDVEDNAKGSLFIKKKGTSIYLDYLSISTKSNTDKEKELMDFIFIITKSKCGEEDTISFINSSSINSDVVQYIGSYNDRIKFYNDTNNIDMRENTCFSIELLPINKYVSIRNFISNKLLSEIDNGTLAFNSEDNNTSLFKVEKWEKSKNKVIIKAPSNKYLSIDFNNDNSLVSNVNTSDKHLASKFIIKKSNNGYIITDDANIYTLYSSNDNIPLMIDNDKIDYMINKNEINIKDNVFKIINYYNLV